MASIRCSPPESVPASCLRRRPSTGNRSKARSSTSALLRPGRRKVYMSRFSATVRLGKTERPSGIMHTPVRARARWLAGPASALHLHRTGRRGHLARDHLEQRGLAGPVGTEEGERGTPGHFERDAVEHLDAPVGGPHVADRDGGGRSLRRSCAVGDLRADAHPQRGAAACPLPVTAERSIGCRPASPAPAGPPGSALRGGARCRLLVPAQVGLLDQGVGPHLGRHAAGDDLAVVEDVDPGADPMTRAMSCSTSSTAMPSVARSRSTAPSAAVSSALRPELGSSSRSTLGLVARARAISTSRASPVGRASVGSSAMAVMPTRSSWRAASTAG